MSVFLSSCQLIEIQDYVHAPTQKLRQSLIYSGYKEIDGVDDRLLVFVPNFRTFTESFSRHQARLLVLSSLDEEIHIRQVLLRNLDTTYSMAIEPDPNQSVLKFIEGTKYSIQFLLLIDEDSDQIEKFNTAQKLELVVTYSIGEEGLKDETMVIELVTKKDIAWAT